MIELCNVHCTYVIDGTVYGDKLVCPWGWDPHRNGMDTAQSSDWKGEGWYRVVGSAGTRISETNPGELFGGTYYPGKAVL